MPARIGGVGRRVLDVKCLIRQDRPADERLAVRRPRPDRSQRLLLGGARASRRHPVDQLAVESKHGGVGASTEPAGVLGDGPRHRRQVRRRAADDPEDLARRRLLVPGRGQRAVFLLQGLGARSLSFQALRQALFERLDCGAFIRRGPAGRRSLGSRLPLRGLCTATHQPLLGCLGRAIDDKRGEGCRAIKRRRYAVAIAPSARSSSIRSGE